MRYSEVVKKLCKAGWVEVRVCGSHHQFKHVRSVYVVTVPKHSGKDVSIGVIKRIEGITGLSLLR